MSEAPQRRAADKQWHLDRTVSVGHMVSTLSLLIVGIVYVTDINSKVETHDERLSGIEETITLERENMIRMFEEQKDDSTRAFDQLRDDMKSINQKLDKLIERELAK